MYQSHYSPVGCEKTLSKNVFLIESFIQEIHPVMKQVFMTF